LCARRTRSSLEERQSKRRRKGKGTPSVEEEFSMEVTLKDKKDDIQIQKATEILKPVLAEDVFKNLPISAKRKYR
jgi:hypothetical protein